MERYRYHLSLERFSVFRRAYDPGLMRYAAGHRSLVDRSIACIVIEIVGVRVRSLTYNPFIHLRFLMGENYDGSILAEGGVLSNQSHGVGGAQWTRPFRRVFTIEVQQNLKCSRT